MENEEQFNTIQEEELASDTVKRKRDIKSYFKALSFLALEILAIFGFNLGNSVIFLTCCAVVLAIIAVLFIKQELNADGLSSFAFFLFPLFFYGLLTICSYFKNDPDFNLSGFTLIFVPLGLTAMSLCGYFLSLNREFKIKNALLVIYSAISIYVLINLIATLVEFTPMYTLNYKDAYLYYDGAPSDMPIADMAFALMGFKMSEVSLRYFSMFPSVLLSAFIPLFFTKFKEDRKRFILFLAFGILGFISLVLTPNKWTLITDILVVIAIAFVVLWGKLKWKYKTVRNILIVLGGCFALGLLVFIFNAQEGNNFIKSIVSSNPLTLKIFTQNGIAQRFNVILKGLFSSYKVFGTPTYPMIENLDGAPFTGCLLIDNFITSGVFGALLFIVAFVFGIRKVMQYVDTSKDELSEKMTIVGFIAVFFTYSLLNFDATPFVFDTTIIPIFESSLFLLCMFMFSYCFARNIKEVPVKAKAEEKEVEVYEEEVTL